MRKGFLGALGALVTGAGLAAAQSAPAFQPAVAVPYPSALGGSSAPGQMLPAYRAPSGPPPGAMYQPGWAPPPGVRVFAGPGQAPPPPTLPAPLAAPPSETLPASDMSEEHSVSTPLGPSSSLPYSEVAESVFADGGSPAIGPDDDIGECGGWLAAEYLVWFTRRGGLPNILVSTGPPTNRTLLGNTFDYDEQQGVRVHGGRWLCTDFGVEVGGLMLIEHTTRQQFGSNATGNPQITRPFLNGDTGLPEIGIATGPDQFAGSVTVESTSQLWGAEANFLVNVGRCDCCSLNLIGGARYLHLNEGLDITQNSTIVSPNGAAFFLGTPLAVGQGVVIRDAFDGNNDFVGGQVGSQFGVQCGNCFLGITTKVAVGVTYETVDVRGNTTLLVGDGTIQATPGGLLAVGSNRTRHTSSELAFVPEANVELAFQITPKLTATLGYTFLYWTKVVRATEQASTFVSGSQIPVSQTFTGTNPLGQPQRPFNDGVFWAQGVSAGLAFRY